MFNITPIAPIAVRYEAPRLATTIASINDIKVL